MKTEQVTVHTAHPYEVRIARGLLADCGAIIRRAFPGHRCAVITDERVGSLYGAAVTESLRSAGAEPVLYAFPGGEEHKTLTTLGGILSFLAAAHITRGDLLVALGGGIVGDVAGMAASVYLRGIPFVQIPTTLLAAVDSSVGGKTGVNLDGLKNQVGTFWQPSLVLCDPDAFRTLPEEMYACGMAEVIKYGVIFDRALFDSLRGDFREESVIRDCVRLKASVVEADERDTGVRQLLNFGHTVGHAIERATDHAFPHGYAVACGMVAATRAACRLGVCREPFTAELEALLRQHHLPLSAPCSPAALLAAMENDKKRSGNTVTLVLPESLGHCILQKFPVSELGSALDIK